jgi:hypothetical protein
MFGSFRSLAFVGISLDILPLLAPSSQNHSWFSLFQCGEYYHYTLPAAAYTPMMPGTSPGSGIKATSPGRSIVASSLGLLLDVSTHVFPTFLATSGSYPSRISHMSSLHLPLLFPPSSLVRQYKCHLSSPANDAGNKNAQTRTLKRNRSSDIL